MMWNTGTYGNSVGDRRNMDAGFLLCKSDDAFNMTERVNYKYMTNYSFNSSNIFNFK